MTAFSATGHPSLRTALGIAVVIAAVSALVLYLMGQPAICKCGYVKLWHGDTTSSENSQHVADWYALSHIIHGLLFYMVLSLVAGRMPLGLRLVAASLVEAAWEIFENTDFVINRYRESTLSLDYFGDSVINSLGDLGFMVAGFLLAWRLPVWLSVVLAVTMELVALYAIRDNLTLNIVMLLFPVEAIKTWQLGG